MRRPEMPRTSLQTAAIALAFAVLPGAIGWRVHQAAALQTTPAPQKTGGDPALVERGRYLVSAMGCHDCHTPWKPGPRGPEPDMSRALIGHPSDVVMPPPPKLPEGPWLWMA